jgi:thymidine kinase
MSALPQRLASAARPHGQLELICGPMFSGKSEELMRRLRRVGYARKTAILVKPAIDDRYSVDEVVSHEGQRMAARGRRSCSSPPAPTWSASTRASSSTTR